MDKAQLKRQQRQLQNFCAQLVDKHEEQLSTALQKGLDAEGNAYFACYVFISKCQ